MFTTLSFAFYRIASRILCKNFKKYYKHNSFINSYLVFILQPEKQLIMKTGMKFKMMTLAVFVALLFSCKNNKDGYSDEIETSPVPIDSTEKVDDSASTGAGSTQNAANSETMGTGTTGSGSTEGTGIGPGESPQDGSTYTESSGVQKDSIKPEIKAKKKNQKK